MDLGKGRQIIGFPYKGSRQAYHVYHPAKHGPPAMDGQWERAKAEFVRMLNDFTAVCELYNDEQIRHQTVGGGDWKKDILKFVDAIEAEGKSVYELEAVAEMVFDVDDKTDQRATTYHAEVKRVAEIIRFEDSGLIAPQPINPSHITKLGWTGR